MKRAGEEDAGGGAPPAAGSKDAAPAESRSRALWRRARRWASRGRRALRIALWGRYGPARLGAQAAVAVAKWDPFAFVGLARRIVMVNAIALVVLLTGVLLVKELRQDLIDIRHEELARQALIVANAVSAEASTRFFDPQSNNLLDRARAERVLRRLSRSTGLRAQLYDTRGRLMVDTRTLSGVDHPVERLEIRDRLPPESFLGRLEALMTRGLRLFDPPRRLYREAGPLAISLDPVVYEALSGELGRGEYNNSEGELIVTVAAPVSRVRLVRGAVAVSTAGGDIDGVLTEERRNLLGVFAVAFFVLVVASAVMAWQVASPLRKLAKAADAGAGAGPLNPARIQIPDLSDRKDEIGRLSGSLRRMTSALYSRIEAIETFAADVSHEIKNPLTSLGSAIESLRLAKTEKQKERLLAVIEHDVRRLDRLVTDISAASRLDAELVLADREDFDLRRLLENCVALASSLGEARRISVTFEADPHEDLRLRGLEDRLAQVFHNLLDNARSFCSEGGAVIVRARRAASGRRLIVEVLDDGPGLPPENLESIFLRFYTQRPPDEGFGQHSGLGLSIARQIVEAHGGRLTAANRDEPNGPPTGAVFTVDLPR